MKVNKVKLFLCMPIGIEEIEATRLVDNRQNEGGKLLSPKHRPPLSLVVTLVLISVKD